MGQMVAGIIVWCVSPYLEYEKLNWRILSAAGCVPGTLAALIASVHVEYASLRGSVTCYGVSLHHL